MKQVTFRKAQILTKWYTATRSKYYYYLIISFLSVVGLIVYFPTFNNGFQLFWDDQVIVINFYTIEGLTWDNLSRVISEYYAGQYAPVNEVYYILLHHIFGYDAFWFHAASLLIHLANAVLLYFFIFRVVGYDKQYQVFFVQQISFLTALLFIIHPFLVEAVAWVSASKVLLYALFYLLSLHSYLKYTESLNLKYFLATIFFYMLSFGSKEQAVTLPVCLLLLDLALSRNFHGKRLWLEKIPFFGISIFFGLIAIKAQEADGLGFLTDQEIYPVRQRFVFASYTVIEYMVKCILPMNLSHLYPFPNQPGEPLPLRLYLYPFLFLLGIVFLWGIRKHRWIFFGLSFFLIHISLVCNLIPLSRSAMVADRYGYLPSIGIFLVIAYSVSNVKIQKAKEIICFYFLVMTYFFYLGIYSFNRIQVWHDSNSLKRELKYLETGRRFLKH